MGDVHALGDAMAAVLRLQPTSPSSPGNSAFLSLAESENRLLDIPLLMFMVGDDDDRTDQAIEPYFAARGVYLDAYRTRFLREAGGRIQRFIRGELFGHHACFLILGIHGVGKSQFLLELGRYMTASGGARHAFCYVVIGVCEESTTLRQLIYRMAAEQLWENVPEQCWPTIDACWDWLDREKRFIVIVLDEYQNVYEESAQSYAGSLISELYGIGSRSQCRYIMVFLCGSRAHLRPLAFKRIDLKDVQDCLSHQYKGYPVVAKNLNSTKFVPVEFGPIASLADMKRVWTAICCSEPPDDEHLANICFQTGGLIRSITSKKDDGFIGAPSSTKTSLFKSVAKQRELMEFLYHNYVTKTSFSQISQLLDLMAEDDLSWSEVATVAQCMEHVADLKIQQLYQLADDGSLYFTGGNHVGFAHPSDILAVMRLLGRDIRPRKLSPLEQLSLLFSYNSGLCDINETLVAESLTENGWKYSQLGARLRFKNCYNTPYATGLCRTQGKNVVFDGKCVNDEDKNHFGVIKRGRILHQIRIHPAGLRKELPDESGGDLIAIFAVEDQVLGAVKYLVFRVQVKLGCSVQSRVPADVFTKMIEHEKWFVARLSVRADEVCFVRLLWTAQSTTLSTIPEQNLFVIESKDMLPHWSQRIRSFVVAKRLATYGYRT